MSKNNSQLFTTEIVKDILSDQAARRIIVTESHLWFFHLYFYEYIKYPTADFQKEIISITEDDEINMATILAFRGSSKSTIVTTSYPIWAILGKPKKKFVMIISQTQQQVKIHFANLRAELETNELLRSDLGPFREEANEWGSYSIVLPKFDARIIAVSSEQSIRGIRHKSHRPDLIICDDLEDINSVKTKEGRDKIYDWFTSDIIPLGDKNTKIMVVGNLLNQDSLLSRLQRDISENKRSGVFKHYPLKNDLGEILWPGKFLDESSIEEYRKVIGNERSWQREVMLKVIEDEDQIIKQEWFKYYDELPPLTNEYRFTATAIDLAISQRESADFTAMVTAHVYSYKDALKIYILPHPVNKRMNFPETVQKAKQVANTTALKGGRSRLFAEDVAYQRSFIQTVHDMGYIIKGVQVGGSDKRARLSSITHLLESGKVFFPKDGVEDLTTQLLFFGRESHDDLTDAFTMLLSMIYKESRFQIQILPAFY